MVQKRQRISVYLAEQCPDSDLRPAFEIVEPGENIGDGTEASALDIGFAGSHFGLGDVAEVDHAEVDLANGGFIVVDKAGDGFFVRGVDNDFFLELAAHAFAVNIVCVADFGVDRGDVAADTDAVLRSQPGFATAAAALVFEEVDGAARVGPAEQAVGDELLEGGVGFHFAARAILDVIAFDDARKISLGFA